MTVAARQCDGAGRGHLPFAVETGSVSSGAQSLGIKASTITKRIMRLEDETWRYHLRARSVRQDIIYWAKLSESSTR
jgi:hypothetical protein